MNANTFVEISYFQIPKNGQNICGDTFLSMHIKEENRFIAVLSDGLGSGIKASVLSTLTSTIVCSCASKDLEIKDVAKMIMETLPVCSTRKIGYSTFTIVDINSQGDVSIIEYDNPSFLWFRKKQIQTVIKDKEVVVTEKGKIINLMISRFSMGIGDRIAFFSDGVSQAGLGLSRTLQGWPEADIIKFINKKLVDDENFSARQLSEMVANQAYALDDYKARDDITVASIFFRQPRKTLLITGPPYDKESDVEIIELARNFSGTKIVAGGTTSSIIAKGLNKDISLNIDEDISLTPPTSMIEGIDLVTEGTITLMVLESYLESKEKKHSVINAATKILDLLLNSDIIEFIVGTKINNAHYDPSLPVELDIRRNKIRRIASLLEKHFFKQTVIRFI